MTFIVSLAGLIIGFFAWEHTGSFFAVCALFALVSFCAVMKLVFKKRINLTLLFAAVSILLCPDDSVAYFSVAMAGGLLGFLLFNFNPAKVFMGDTGSLAIGGAMGACVILLQRPLLLVIAGFLFVIEALSVILQVSFFKITKGKRLFRMAPIHHHFELCGWSERKVVTIFWIFTLFCCVLAYFSMR